MSSTPIMPFQQNEKSASHRILRHDIFHSSGRTARAFKDNTSFPEGIDFSVREDADLRRLMDECFFLKSCLRGVTHL